MTALFLLSLGAFAATPLISSVGSLTNPNGNTMMTNVPVTFGAAGIMGTDHRAYLGIGTSLPNCSNMAGLPGAPGTWKYGNYQTVPAAGATLNFIAYNFEPGTSYYYKVAVGNGASGWRTSCDTLLTPTLPTGLADLNLSYTDTGSQDSNYVLFDIDDCSGTGNSGNALRNRRKQLVVVNTTDGAAAEGEIVWYLDIQDASLGESTTGFHYHAGTGTQTGHILAVVDHQYLYDWNFDGTVNNQGPIDLGSGSPVCEGAGGEVGPCFSHDAFYSDSTSRTYVLATNKSAIDYTGLGTGWDTSTADGCGSDVTPGPTASFFTDDGYEYYTGAPPSLAFSNFIVTDHGGAGDIGDPTVAVNDGEGACLGGYWDNALEDYTIDWTHINSISAYRPATVEYVDISLKNWDEVIRFDGMGGLKWRMTGDGRTGTGIFTVTNSVSGDAAFADQHGVHVDPATGDILMFDNTGDTTGSRGLRIDLTCSNPGACTAGDIGAAWYVVDPANTSNARDCPDQGSAELVGSSGSILLDCNDYYLIEEFDSAAGDGATGHTPDLVVTLPYVGLADGSDSTTDGDTNDDNVCDGDGYPTERALLRGLYRAYPLATVGEY
jgi:hypothetical protein